MAKSIEHLVISIVRCFCVVQKQKGVADAMIEAEFLSIQIPHELRNSLALQRHLTHGL